MSNIIQDPNIESIRQTTDSNTNSKIEHKKKKSKIKIDKQMSNPAYKLKTPQTLDKNNDFSNFADEKKNEDIVLKAIQDKWYIEFNRLIYSKKYSNIILLTLALTCLLIILSFNFIIFEFAQFLLTPSIIILLTIISFSLLDIAIKYYIMVILL